MPTPLATRTTLAGLLSRLSGLGLGGFEGMAVTAVLPRGERIVKDYFDCVEDSFRGILHMTAKSYEFAPDGSISVWVA